jgi:biofilm protein TabA
LDSATANQRKAAMILDDLSRAALYEPIHKGLTAAFEFLRRRDVADLPNGRHQIVDDLVYVLISREEGRNGVGRLEAHRKYIDVQYVVAGEERIGWRPVEGLQPSTEYETDRDIQFFHDEPTAWFDMKPGEFAIFLPTDAHAPLAGKGAIHKAVVKVAVDYR